MTWFSSAVGSVRHPVLVGIGVLLAPALWVLFVASGNPHELVLGVAVSVATLMFTIFVCRSSQVALTLRARDVMQLWRIPGYVVSGVYTVAAVAMKDLVGGKRAASLYRVCGFDTSLHDPVRQARTILAIAYTTATPNFIVIGVDPAQSRMLFHQIAPTTVPKMTKALGAKG